MPKEKCTSRARSTGTRCGRYPTPGATVCTTHGSRAPQVRRKAAERLAEQDAMKILKSMNIEPVEDPLTALQTIAGEVVAWKEILAGKVTELKGDFRYQLPAGEQLRAEVALFERAMDRCVTTLAAISKLNIDDRLARVREREADMLEKAMNAAFLKIGLSNEQQRQARFVVSQELRALTAS